MLFGKRSPSSIISAFVFFMMIFYSSPVTDAQSVNAGIKLEALNYFYKNPVNGYSNESLMILPLSAYFKTAVNFSGTYEVELKAGIQLDENFSGYEGALVMKYNVGKGFYPLITYMAHFNGGDSRNLNGTYDTKFNFLGAGIEAKATKVFGIDLIYYFPIGDNKLTYSRKFTAEGSRYSLSTTNITSLIKLGFIFNITII